MSFESLAGFIDERRTAIVQEWEQLARSSTPAATSLTALALQNNADAILTAIVADMTTLPSPEEKDAKGKGPGAARRLTEIGHIHGALRIVDGFTLGQLVSEYRALRASVLCLWEREGTDLRGVTRFNECIDEALAEAVDRFTQSTDRYRDISLGILGHDLRNPLSAILTGTQLLLVSTSPDDRLTVVVGRMLNSAKRMDRMISDLLDLTRTRFGQHIPIVRAAMDLSLLCQQVIAELESAAPDGTLLFEASGDLRVDWDQDRIAQVFSNLLRNAIQHGVKGEPIEVAARGDADAVTISVHNAGSIPANAQVMIFEPMVRHVSDPARSLGLGLGLYIASRIVAAHDGTLDVSSSDDAGTTFTARLPRR